MKKTIILTSVVFLLFSASIMAQSDPVTPEKPAAPPATTDKWNNPDVSKYQLLPMPEPLTTEKMFPAIGKYQLTDKDGNAITVTTKLDEDNKGILWVSGLPEGTIKALLKQSPAGYKIPVQKTEEGKDIAEGVLIYDKGSNTMNICLGCVYNTDDPTIAFSAEEPVAVQEAPKKGSKKSTAKAVIKPVRYSGSKMMVETASLEVNAPMQ
jgi:hypothetical protein